MSETWSEFSNLSLKSWKRLSETLGTIRDLFCRFRGQSLFANDLLFGMSILHDMMQNIGSKFICKYYVRIGGFGPIEKTWSFCLILHLLDGFSMTYSKLFPSS